MSRGIKEAIYARALDPTLNRGGGFHHDLPMSMTASSSPPFTTRNPHLLAVQTHPTLPPTSTAPDSRTARSAPALALSAFPSSMPPRIPPLQHPPPHPNTNPPPNQMLMPHLPRDAEAAHMPTPKAPQTPPFNLTPPPLPPKDAQAAHVQPTPHKPTDAHVHPSRNYP
jgi:hypothetical protein